MKKMSILIVLLSVGMFMSGCSKTWSGVKHDSKKAWKKSKKAVHDATE